MTGWLLAAAGTLAGMWASQQLKDISNDWHLLALTLLAAVFWPVTWLIAFMQLLDMMVVSR